MVTCKVEQDTVLHEVLIPYCENAGEWAGYGEEG